MFTITITWHLIMTIVINLAIVWAVMDWAGDDNWGRGFGLIFLVLVSAIIWSIYGGIVWW